MKADNTTARIDCPACAESLTIPVTLRMTGRATASVTYNTSVVQDHLKTHADAEGSTEEAIGERP